MTAPQRPNLTSVMTWLFFATMAVAVLWGGARELATEIRSYRWEQTEGRVTGVDSRRAFRDVAFVYTVDGRSYSAAHDLMVIPFRKIPAAGDAVTVTYDPQDPGQALLRRGLGFDGGLPLVVAGVVMLAILIAVLRSRWLRKSMVAAHRPAGTAAALHAGLQERLASPPQFRRWAGQRWSWWEKLGPLAIAPARKGHAPRFWQGRLDVHALLFDADHFVDLADYFLFAWYTSSIQQFIAREEPFTLADWFVPGVAGQQVLALEKSLGALPVPTGPEATHQMVLDWRLPASCAWLNHLTYRAAWVRSDDHGVEMTAVCAEGYLSFFALQV